MHGRLSSLLPFLVVLLALAASAAQGALAPAVREDLAVALLAQAPPLTFVAGIGGATTFGFSLASASTVASLPPSGEADLLRVGGPDGWTVDLQIRGVAGHGVLDQVDLALVGPASTQVVVDAGGDAVVTGTAIGFSADGEVQVKASGSCAGTCTFTLWLVATSPGGALVALPYTMALT